MSFFIERSQLSHPDNVSEHLGGVYHQLFPSSSWTDVPKFSLAGLSYWLPPIMTNSERIGYRVDKKEIEYNSSPFVFRYELPKQESKLGYRLLLADMLVEPLSFNPKKSSIFFEHMNHGDRYGGIVTAAIGFLKPQYAILPEPPGPSCFYVRQVQCLGIENNGKPTALIYFKLQN